MTQPFLQKGDWALVTGATSGIGKAFAEQLAIRGIHLFLVAREEEELSKLAGQWSKAYQVQTAFLSIDLSAPDSFEKILREIENKNLHVDILINAAGFGYFGDFCAMRQAQIQGLVQIHATVIVQLCRFCLPSMQSRKKGVIINIASVAGFLPYPFGAVYCAAKSFVRIFTNALWAENRERNVKIIALCPGYTKTNFEKVAAEPSSIHLFPGEDPVKIAKKTLACIEKAPRTLFTSWTHPFKIFAAKILPLKVFTGILRFLIKRGER